jgi:hypothetical protein
LASFRRRQHAAEFAEGSTDCRDAHTRPGGDLAPRKALPAKLGDLIASEDYSRTAWWSGVSMIELETRL